MRLPGLPGITGLSDRIVVLIVRPLSAETAAALQPSVVVSRLPAGDRESIPRLQIEGAGARDDVVLAIVEPAGARRRQTELDMSEIHTAVHLVENKVPLIVAEAAELR